jgi:hypothetical protein
MDFLRKDADAAARKVSAPLPDNFFGKVAPRLGLVKAIVEALRQLNRRMSLGEPLAEPIRVA